MKGICNKLYEPFVWLARSLPEWTSRLVSMNEAHCQEGGRACGFENGGSRLGSIVGNMPLRGGRAGTQCNKPAASRRVVATRGTNKRVEMTHLDLNKTDTVYTNTSTFINYSYQCGEEWKRKLTTAWARRWDSHTFSSVDLVVWSRQPRPHAVVVCGGIQVCGVVVDLKTLQGQPGWHGNKIWPKVGSLLIGLKVFSSHKMVHLW